MIKSTVTRLHLLLDGYLYPNLAHPLCDGKFDRSYLTGLNDFEFLLTEGTCYLHRIGNSNGWGVFKL